MSLLAEAGNALLDFLYPPKCYLCEAVGTWLCDACIAAWPEPERPRCPRCGCPLRIGGCRCGDELPPLAAAGFRAVFDGGAREAVHLLKYGGKRRLAAPLAEAMAGVYRASPALQGADAVVPLPLSRRRLRQRGYNQAGWLAEELARALDLPVVDCLTRVRHTHPQVGLTREMRKENVRGAFAAGEAGRGRRVLLIDDVCTTGATARDAARALREAGAAWVGLLTFARDL